MRPAKGPLCFVVLLKPICLGLLLLALIWAAGRLVAPLWHPLKKRVVLRLRKPVQPAPLTAQPVAGPCRGLVKVAPFKIFVWLPQMRWLLLHLACVAPGHGTKTLKALKKLRLEIGFLVPECVWKAQKERMKRLQ
jgi:hypothetical protein